jgi:hypothetical protein
MLAEQERREVPPVPGLRRLTWLLFMQPIQLHRLFTAWGFERDPSLLELWPRIKARDPVVRALLVRWALLLVLVMPTVTVLAVGLLMLVGFPVDWYAVARGVVSGVAFGVVSGVARGVAAGVASGVAFGVAAGVTLGVVAGVAFGVVSGVTLGVALGVALGVTAGVTLGVAAGVTLGVTLGVVAGVLAGVVGGVAFGVAAGVVSCVAYVVARFRVPLWPLEALASFALSWCARLAPERAVRLSRWLPFRLHDLIYLPLPGLRLFLLQLAELDPTLTQTLIAEAAASVGQKGVAQRTLLELEASALERAARDRRFDPIADLDVPFLPSADALDAASPVRFFQRAARDLGAGGDNHRQRRLALERARKALDDLITTTATSPRPGPLARRLVLTARLWLDIVRDEERKLAAAEAKGPQVPLAFVAGVPLSPDLPSAHSLFKGRTDLARLIDHDLDPDRRGVLVVVGQRRMGKSSFRNWLPRLLGTGTDVRVANFQHLSGHPHCAAPHRWLVELVAEALPSAPPPPDGPHWTEALAWLRARDAALEGRRVLVVVDEVERVQEGVARGELSTEFLDFLRAAGDELCRIRFLLLTAYSLPRLGRHWVDRLISATVRGLSYLDPASAEELVRRPIPHFPDIIYPEGGVARILRETHGHPYLVQKIGDELCKHLNAHGGLRPATDDELTDVLDQVAGENLFDELWGQHQTPEEQRALHRLACASGPLEADPVMRGLAREGYVEMRGEMGTLAVPLFGAWIRCTQGRIVA